MVDIINLLFYNMVYKVNYVCAIQDKTGKKDDEVEK